MVERRLPHLSRDVQRCIAAQSYGKHVIRPTGSNCSRNSENLRAAARWKRRILASLMLAGVVVSFGDAEAQVTQCFANDSTGLCPIGTSTCQVTSATSVADNAVIDCGAHDVVVTGSGNLTVNGKMTLRARDLTVANDHTIRSTTVDPTKAEIIIELSGNLYLSGQLEARNTGGGSEIRVTAAQDIILQQASVGVDVTGQGQSNDGGELLLQAGHDVRISSKIYANGNDGTTSSDQNSGGDVELIAGAGVYVNELIRVYGRWFNGGELKIKAAGDVQINHDHDGTANGRKGEINLQGKAEDGDGGTLEIDAGGAVLMSGPVSLSAGTGNGGGNATGGDTRIEAGCGGVRLEEPLEAWGGMGGGGDLSIDSRGNVAIATEIWLDSKKLGGNGGNASLTSRMGTVTLESSAKIHANGHVTTNAADGVGGTVALHGCRIDVTAGAVVESLGQTKGRFDVSSYNKGTQLQNSYGVRISESADINAYSTGEKILLRTATVQAGKCQGFPTVSCTLDSECPSNGCSYAPCVGANPELDGQRVQFSSLPVIEQDATLGPCAASCQ